MKKEISVLLTCCMLCYSSFSQNVGIGTNTPAFKLDVNGRMRVKTGTIGNLSSSSGIWLEDFRDGTNQVFVGMQDSIRVGFYGTGDDGVGWGFNFNAKTGNVGIGIVNALSALHIHSPFNTFNSYMRLTHQGSGTGFSDGAYVGLDGNNLLINNSEAGDILFTMPGGTQRFKLDNSGNVGIDVASPTEKFHVAGNIKLQSATAQVVFHNNSADRAALRLEGNDITLGSVSGNPNGRVIFKTNNNTDRLIIASTGEVNRPRTGNADIIPIAYGRIFSNGTIANSAGLSSIVKEHDGKYRIRISGEDISASPTAYTIVVTPFLTGADDFTYASSRITIDGDDIVIEMGKFFITYSNHQDCGCTENLNSHINVQGYGNADIGFSFIVYKP